MNKKHLLSISITTILVLLIVYVAQMYTTLNLPTIVYPVIVVLGVLSFLFGEWISKAINERPALYVNRYMIAFIVKMFSFLTFVGIYLYINPENKIPVALTLLACYLIFKVHMIGFLKSSEKKHLLENPTSKKTN